MDLFHNLVKSLEPNQKQFVPDPSFDLVVSTELLPQTSVLLSAVKNQLTTLVSRWKTMYKFTDEETNKLEIFPIGNKNSLYDSLLCLIYHKYLCACTYVQKSEMIEEFIRFIISKMETNPKIKSFLQNTRLRQNQLIEEIRNCHYQSPDVIYYLSILFDLNIIVLSSNELELYYSENRHDNCKPHILLYKDPNHIYSPIFYKNGTDAQFLTYHENPLIKCLTDNFNKKVICHENYVKKINTPKINRTTVLNNADNKTIDYKNEPVTSLRKIAENVSVDILKVSAITGRRIYKTKGELLNDLQKHTSPHFELD